MVRSARTGSYGRVDWLPLGHAPMAAGQYSGFRLIIDPTQSNVVLKNGTTLTVGIVANTRFRPASDPASPPPPM